MLPQLKIETSNNLFIDVNHTDLANAIENVKKAWLSYGASDNFTQACASFLEELREHFSHEEIILRGAGYEHLEVHSDSHTQILVLLEAILNVGMDENTGTYFLDKVREKLFEHELVADQGYWHLFESEDFAEGNAITWAAQMETGVPSIDAHHKSLVRYINRLAHRIEGGTTNELLVSELEQLYAYSAHHFHEEEVELTRKGPGASSRHRQAHLNLLEDLIRTINKLSTEKVPPKALPTYLGLWLSNHVMAYDVAEFSSRV
ncbi:hemerythrin domain-containing protein [Magnetovibrio sp. PR-2]|uniref:hemerythrin domain-containing protein n=1 Tax=Magnetovibrio sp. PR-2 TaxID=3120356 RepID=UPI002FCDE9D7